MIGQGKGGGAPAQQSMAGGGNMLTALAHSPIMQHLAGNTPPAPEMAGKSVNEPSLFGLSQAQKNYWSERARQQGNLENQRRFDPIDPAATEARHAPIQQFQSARTSQPSLDEILKAIGDQANRYRTQRR